MDKIFFDSWDSIVRTLVISVLAYVLLVILLRVSGKRTLSKMNAFDFIVTIALGSTLATVLLNKDVALADGVLAFTLLISFQYLITYLSARSNKVSKLVKSSPTLLVYRGKMLEAAMKKERIAKDEIFAIVREKGFDDLECIDAIVLETDGTLTVIKKVKDMDTPTMSHVKKQTI